MLKKLSVKRNKKGFTLVELIVVIAILGILAAIAVPRLSGVRDSSSKKADQATAATIAKAAQVYVVDKNISEPTGEEITVADPGTGAGAAAKLKYANNVTIAKLVTEKLLDKAPTPQYKPSTTKKFVLTYEIVEESGEFVVRYGDKAVATAGTKLYPAK